MAFVDVRMPPGWDGVETITRSCEVYAELQVVICTAYSDYSWDQVISRLGHSDNMVILKKSSDNIEVLQLARALTTKWRLAQQAKCQLEDLDRMVRARTEELQSTNGRLQQEINERRQAGPQPGCSDPNQGR
jgi:DNA-binding LytR/AlgR family response regulator